MIGIIKVLYVILGDNLHDLRSHLNHAYKKRQQHVLRLEICRKMDGSASSLKNAVISSIDCNSNKWLGLHSVSQ